MAGDYDATAAMVNAQIFDAESAGLFLTSS